MSDLFFKIPPKRFTFEWIFRNHSNIPISIPIPLIVNIFCLNVIQLFFATNPIWLSYCYYIVFIFFTTTYDLTQVVKPNLTQNVVKQMTTIIIVSKSII
jgi:hypothetical protein